MWVDIIEDQEGFNRLRENWNAVYDSDPDGQYFLSWDWLGGYLAKLQGPWLVLAAKPSTGVSDYVAFFPLRLRTKERDGGFYNELIMAGNHWADYTGFICEPRHQDAAISAFAEKIKKLNWAYLMLENIRASDDKIERLLRHFPEKKFKHHTLERVNKTDNIDNCICPYVALPENWDAYLATVSTNTRQKMRRFLRQLDNSPDLRITHADANTIESDLKILLQFWRVKWAPRKGDRIDILVRSNYANLLTAFHDGQLFLPVLWRGELPLGGLASLVDPRKKSLLFYLGARDESVNNPPPGFLLHTHSLRYAIGQGIRTYDFLRGNEPYKSMFNTRELQIKCIHVVTKTGRNLGGRLDKRCLPVLLQRASSLHEAGKLMEAERGYRQALQIDARCAGALYCLGQMMALRGNHSEAIRLYRSLLEIKPDSAKVWARLGNSYYARRQFSESIKCYREALQQQPEFLAAQNALNLALIKTGRRPEHSNLISDGDSSRYVGNEQQL